MALFDAAQPESRRPSWRSSALSASESLVRPSAASDATCTEMLTTNSQARCASLHTLPLEVLIPVSTANFIYAARASDATKFNI